MFKKSQLNVLPITLLVSHYILVFCLACVHGGFVHSRSKFFKLAAESGETAREMGRERLVRIGF